MKAASVFLSVCLASFTANGQETIDYASLKLTNASLSGINLGSSFIIKNFSHCYNLKLTHGQRDKVWEGRQLEALFADVTANDLKNGVTVSIRNDTPLKQLQVGQKSVSINIPTSPVTITASSVADCQGDSVRTDLTPPKDPPADNEKIKVAYHPYYDALALKDFLKTHNKAGIKAILYVYGIRDSTELAANRYLDNLLKASSVFSEEIQPSTATVKNNLTSTPQVGTGEFVTILTDALAQFIAKRFKEELTLAYLDRFKEYLKKAESNYHIGTLLPGSYRVVNQVDPFEYTSFLQSMQEGFRDDIAQLPENTFNFVRINKDKYIKGSGDTIVTTRANLYAGTMTSLYITRGLYRKYSAVSIVDSLSALEDIKLFQDKNLIASLEILSLLSRNLHHLDESDEEGSQGWLKASDWAYMADANTANLFLGLLIQKEQTTLAAITFQDGMSVLTLLNQIGSANTSKFLANLVPLLTRLEELQTLEVQVTRDFEALREQDKTKTGNATLKTSFERYLTLATRTLNVLDYAADVLSKLSSNSRTVSAAARINKLDGYLATARNAVDLTRHMYEKRYGLAFFDAVKLVQDVNLIHDPTNTVWTQLIKYGSFVASVAEADSAQQIVAALESAALPTGSYRRKQQYDFTVSLNSYGGITPFGYETLVGNQVNSSFREGFTIQPTAPVGIYIGTDVKKSHNTKRAGAIGVFLPLIDVGAAFALRLHNNVQALPTLQWNDIIAPGLYVVRNFNKSPITMSLGAQYGPGLRKINFTDTNQEVQARSWWVGLSFTVDIPIFNIHTN